MGRDSRPYTVGTPLFLHLFAIINTRSQRSVTDATHFQPSARLLDCFRPLLLALTPPLLFPAILVKRHSFERYNSHLTTIIHFRAPFNKFHCQHKFLLTNTHHFQALILISYRHHAFPTSNSRFCRIALVVNHFWIPTLVPYCCRPFLVPCTHLCQITFCLNRLGLDACFQPSMHVLEPHRTSWRILDHLPPSSSPTTRLNHLSNFHNLFQTLLHIFNLFTTIFDNL